ncbi:MAG: peptide MFS transporter [Thermoanaerobaculia bacterium]|nr:peptide MFS transporter [Thermoanaerobaculia bacterium]
MTEDPTHEFANGGGELAAPGAKRFFGHPRGLATLFFTEMWERFSYYGMRGILILFMVATAETGGLGFSDSTSAAIYGLYTSMVYLLALPGGWVADKLWGQQKAVFVGGVIIALGHFSLAVPMLPFFFLGLFLIVVGTGLLKPNVSAIVGELYPEGGARRDAGYSIYYMGINIGAFLGPLVCGYLGESIDWHLGFSAAGIGMVLGLIQYRIGMKHLGPAGRLQTTDGPSEMSRRARNFYLTLGAVGVPFFGVAAAAGLGWIALDLTAIAKGLGYAIVILSLLYFAFLFLKGGLTGVEKKRLVVIIWLFILSAIFWGGFEQAGSSLNLFAERLTDRVVMGWEAPASWLQSINPIFIILFAPIFGWLWVALGRFNPSMGLKFAFGLLGLAAGFFVVAWGAANATAADPVSPGWLIVTYFFHTAGELCLSPVGLSSITKLAPKGRVGQMMGVWFIATALGNLVAGLIAGQLETLDPQHLFTTVAWFVAGAGILALLMSPFIKRLTAGAE